MTVRALRPGLPTAMAALVAGRAVLAAATWAPGWSALAPDCYSRVSLALDFAASPYLTHPTDLVWLPLPTWVYGALFWVFGGLFPDNPLLLAAIINFGLVVGAAAITAWTARRLFGTRLAAGVAFAAVLWAPTAVFVSVSGLAEPLYWVAVAGAVAATVAWVQERRLSWLWLAAGCLAVAAGSRYDGWALLGGWAVTVSLIALRDARAHARLRRALPALGVVAVPAVVPLLWMAHNWERSGDPLAFAHRTADLFLGAYGGLFDLSRLTYYPVSWVRAAPLLLAGSAVVAVARRRDLGVAAVAVMVGISVTLLWSSTVLSATVGANTERFLFSSAVALAPLLGGLPRLWAGWREPLRHVTAVALLVAAAFGTARLADRPVEWNASPDLLALADALGRAADGDHPLTVRLGAGMEEDYLPLRVRNGSSVRVVTGGSTGPEGASGSTLWIERLPARIAASGVAPVAVVGRYAVYGEVPLDQEACLGCEGWTRTDEAGVTSPVPPGAYLTVEFTTDTPRPGDEALLATTVARGDRPTFALLEVRTLYGHGFNPGRLELQVRVDGEVVFRGDVAERSAWVAVAAPIPAGSGTTRLEVAVVGQNLLAGEEGWRWGRASTVLVRSLRLADGPLG